MSSELPVTRPTTDAIVREPDPLFNGEDEDARYDFLAAPATPGARPDALFRLLVASVRDYAIFLLDPAGRVATWNAGAERLKGYTAEEIIGRHFSAFYPREDVQAGKCDMVLEVATREGTFESEGWRVRKDGSVFWANVVITAVRDLSGGLVGFAKVTRDLTDRKHAEDERERFRMFVDSVQEYAMVIVDPGGTVETWNVGAERIFGYRADEIIGRPFSVLHPAEDVQAGRCDMELELAARDGHFEDEGWRIRKDGTRFWASTGVTAIRQPGGGLVGFAKITRDLTERKRIEDERAARIAAERASQAKDEFLAMLGHELRNPLAPIVTALQLIKLRGDPRSTREHQVIERQVQHLTNLVDDLLDVSRVARSKLELKKHVFDIRRAIALAVEIAGPPIEDKGHHFQVETPPYPLHVDGDEARLTQVFTNLLTNAAKYTDPGGHIFVRVRHVEDRIIAEIRDDGVGIDQDLLPKVFDLFVQGYQRSDRAGGGLGLGLTLVRSIVQLHGGQVEVRSQGRRLGSTFTVRLPAVSRAAPAETENRIAAAFPAASARRVLLVDDNEDARVLLVDVLAALGHDVRGAGDGPSALELVDEFTPDVAILDIGLPAMDGYELAAQLRRRPATSGVRLIALSGYGQPSDLARSRAAGFDRHLVKPVEVRRLVDTLSELTC